MTLQRPRRRKLRNLPSIKARLYCDFNEKGLLIKLSVTECLHIISTDAKYKKREEIS